MGMKIKLEEIRPGESSSFNLLINPRLSHLFYWHFHPEWELVYIEAESGTCHVGDHTSRYEGSAMAFIGSYIPHLNFDYGVKSDYLHLVLQIKEDFLAHSMISTPELAGISSLFERSKKGLMFGRSVKDQVSGLIKELGDLESFERFMAVLRILQLLSATGDFEYLHKKPVENRRQKKEKERLKQVYTYIDENYMNPIEVEDMADLCHLSKAAFCRYFKKMTRLTFTEFVNHYRISQAQRLLLLNRNVTEASLDSGFMSLSYFNRIFKKITGENPLAFKNRHSGLSIKVSENL
jgi:AraC-like DNA-binding protein